MNSPASCPISPGFSLRLLFHDQSVLPESHPLPERQARLVGGHGIANCLRNLAFRADQISVATNTVSTYIKTMKTKSIQQVFPPTAPHMVGDGFKVHNFFPGGTRVGTHRMSPFFLMDYG